MLFFSKHFYTFVVFLRGQTYYWWKCLAFVLDRESGKFVCTRIAITLVTCIVMYRSDIYYSSVGYCLFVHGYSRTFDQINKQLHTFFLIVNDGFIRWCWRMFFGMPTMDWRPCRHWRYMYRMWDLFGRNRCDSLGIGILRRRYHRINLAICNRQNNHWVY